LFTGSLVRKSVTGTGKSSFRSIAFMKQFPHILVLALALHAVLPIGSAAAVDAKALRPDSAVTTDDQRATLAYFLSRDEMFIAGRALDVPALRRLYGLAGDDLLWTGKDDRVAALAAAFTNASEDGLDFPAPLPDLLKVKTENAVERDLLLSDGALRLAGALAVGRARPELWEEDWAVPAPSFDAVAGLDKALRGGKLGPWFATLAPSDARYLRLKAALAQYRELAGKGGWPQVKGGPTIKPGMADGRVAVIRQRLVAEGFLPVDATGDDTYDEALVAAVNVFQARHGIVPDGTVGARTVAAMNVPVRARVEQIALTLERWRSLPRDFGRNYLFVNVPAESLEVFEDGNSVLAMKVVVGDPNHPTPVVLSRIQAVTFNPVWRIPSSIAKNEIAPKIKADPRYLQKNDMIAKGALQFEQLPGPKNPLGQIKFETPNKFDVYLHDTSTHATFERVARALSHGCVRTENARELALYVLGAAKWPTDEIERAIASNVTQKVDVARHLRVNLLYFTSFVDPDGAVEFRDDIYGRDSRLRAALQGNIPTIAANPKSKPGVG
jgi:murein L,D-transpeptidase YcbB/YkuD